VQTRSIDPQVRPWSKSADGFVYLPYEFVRSPYDGIENSKYNKMKMWV